MDKIIKNILKRIENEGYEAYLVGGYVRDQLLNRGTFDIDICTNALPKELTGIFPNNDSSNNYGGFKTKIKKYNIDITTYRKEKKYDKRKPVEIEYISSLVEDIQRRDFTINSMCMDKNGVIIDIVGGKEDLKNKLIKSIGNQKEKFMEDPLRMLRAIRFATVLDFSIETNTFKEIVNNYKLISTLSNERIKEELTKILNSPNYKKGLTLLKETKIDKLLNLSYKDLVYTSDILGMWSQIDSCNIEFTKTEKEIIKNVKQIIIRKEINNYTLFKYGLYTCNVAADILKIDKKVLNKMYKNMPIHSMSDIDINGTEIITLLNLKPSKKISDIINDIKIQILNNQLKNKKSDIKSYIIKRWKDEQRQ